MNTAEKRIFIATNSPGEISGWLKPVVKTIKKMLPDYKIIVMLLPCVFASGREKYVVETISEVDEIIPQNRFFSLLFDKTDKSRTELLHLGGDIMFTAQLAKVWKTAAWCYQWGKLSIDKYYRGYFVKTEDDKKRLKKLGINENKIHIVGELLVDSVRYNLESELKTNEINEVRTICFMPGSRLKEVKSLLPFYLKIASIISERNLGVRFKALISPYIDWKQLVSGAEMLPLKELPGLKGVIDGEKLKSENIEIDLINKEHIKELEKSDFVITIPGTKTGEAGCLAKPMAVLLPFNKPEDIPYMGIIGLLDWLPVLGPRIKAPIILSLSKYVGWVAQPNILMDREVVPEIKGILNAENVAEKIINIIISKDALEKMRKELLEIYRPFEGTAKRMVNIFARALKPDFEKNRPVFSVIICTRNRKELLEGAIKSLDEQDFPVEGLEILIVDDGSDDGTDEMVTSLTMRSKLRYFKRSWSGRASTRNFGINEAAGDVIVFVDDDILAPKDFLSQHARYHKIYPRTIVRGPIINIEKYEFPKNKKAGIADFSQAFFCTCNVSVGRKELLDIGGFDETFIEYGYEDNEIGWRLRERGLKARFNMGAIVYHYKPRKKELDSMIKTAEELARSAVLYYRKHPHWKVRLATGIYTLNFIKQSIVANKYVRDYCFYRWKEISRNSSDEPLYKLEKRIFDYHYTRTLRNELKRKDK